MNAEILQRFLRKERPPVKKNAVAGARDILDEEVAFSRWRYLGAVPVGFVAKLGGWNLAPERSGLNHAKSLWPRVRVATPLSVYKRAPWRHGRW